jgi:hypothetical protein
MQEMTRRFTQRFVKRMAESLNNNVLNPLRHAANNTTIANGAYVKAADA